VQTTLHFQVTLVGSHIYLANFKPFQSRGPQPPQSQAAHSKLGRQRHRRQANQRAAILVELHLV
jgi:hypothetical protein